MSDSVANADREYKAYARLHHADPCRSLKLYHVDFIIYLLGFLRV